MGCLKLNNRWSVPPVQRWERLFVVVHIVSAYQMDAVKSGSNTWIVAQWQNAQPYMTVRHGVAGIDVMLRLSWKEGAVLA